MDILKCRYCNKELKGQRRKYCNIKCKDRFRWTTDKYKKYKREYKKTIQWKKYYKKYRKKYNQTEKFKKWNRKHQREYQQTDKCKSYLKKFRQTKKWKDYRKKYDKEYSQEHKEEIRKYHKKWREKR